ncbi:uncharacterized protein LOC127706661 [Mytilus californianus]|uniref:uncharacterized protein LOC127706661 n=1 Tax=Mytilus californianus TaxID=6549 RepID=UPI0022459BB7|nr:uncharacterized protein LOC127706661 [Mytilus californianus]
MDSKHLAELDNCIVCPVCNSRYLFRNDKVKAGVFAGSCESCGHFIKFRVKSDINSKITVTINGQQYTVGNEYPPSTKLNTYLRKERISVGTKVMCHEGGCGICLVEAKLYEPMSDTKKSYPINSCLCPLFMCDGWEITTIEAISDVIPKRLAKYNGSQCGFCSPGQVMNMHALLDQNEGNVSMKQVEDAYDDVICRCTGYRPILDAMKSFAQDSPAVRKTTTVDIEELGKTYCHKTGIYNQELDMAGFDVLVDIRGIQGLYSVNFDPTVVLGAGLSITQLIDIFTRSQSTPSLGYLANIKDMLMRMASWAGNLMLKHLHPEFQSDVYVALEAANVKLIIADSTGSNTIPISQFLKTDMTNKVIVAMEVPAMTDDYIVRLYKVAQRAENSHSFVNAGVRMKVGTHNKFLVMEKPCIVFSGISKDFVHAVQTESYLVGKSLVDPSVIQGAMTTLASELNPDPNIDAVEPSVAYRKNVAIGYLYSYILDVVGDTAGGIYRSGAIPLSRPLSSGQQSYDTKPLEWPLTEPMIKLEAMDQTTGRADYINDIPVQQDTLYAAFVTSTVGNAKLQNMDPSKALSMSGVLKFITAKDIPGQNNCFSSVSSTIPSVPEEVLCGGDVMYAGQALAIIVAVDEETANNAAKQVQVTYSDKKTPILSLDDGINKGSFLPDIYPLTKGNAQTAITNSTKQITGSIQFGEQKHFPMETQISYCKPTPEGMNVETSTQWIDNSQRAVAMVLGVNQSRINVTVKRLGGAFGFKITRNYIVSAGCALAAHIMNRPVKLNLEFHTQMKMLGGRLAYRADYTVGCTDQGKLNGIKMTLYADVGYNGNDSTLYSVYGFIDNAYYCENWKITPKTVKTNKPCNTYCRAPGSTPGIFIMESIMEHVAKELQLDPTDVRVLNLYQKGQTTPHNRPLLYCNIRQLTTDLMTSATVKQRQTSVQAYNQANRWKKKGLSVVPMKFEISYIFVHYNAIVNIYAWDGSISIAHGGVEMGQGINTKVAQVCAFELGVPIDIISVKSTQTTSNANDFVTGGSIGTELCCLAVLNCCTALRSRMAPVKAKMQNPSWKDLAQKCLVDKVDLSARFCAFEPGTILEEPQYNSYGVTCTEVELDVLTGQYLINRVDMLFDCGESMNPMVDIGQVEGAFTMGLGYCLSENLKFDPQSGELLTNSTWEYKPPMGKDIPIDFRIQLLKNAPNPKGVLRSKAVGEPPLCMSSSALFALKRCIEAARKDIQKDTYFPLNGPTSVDKLCELCLADPSHFVI